MTDRQLFLTPNFSKTQSSLSSFDDPTYHGFKPFFYFAEGKGLLGGEDEVNTAANYLKINKRTQNLQYLNYFKDSLSKISSDTPYIFLNVAGLNTAIFTGFEGGIQEEREIAISCRMTIDRRVQALLQYYRLACFDGELHRREIVPQNLRRFSMGIYMTEFGGGFNIGDEITNKFSGYEQEDIFLKNHFYIELGGCEISLDSGLGVLEDVSNTSPDYEQTMDIVITFKNSSESAIYRGISAENKITSTQLLLEDIGLQTLDVGERTPIRNEKIKSRITSNTTSKTNNRRLVGNFVNEQVQSVQSDVSSSVQREIQSNITTESLGSAISEFEEALIIEGKKRIGRSIDNALSDAIFGNIGGFSLTDLRTLVQEAQGANVSYVFRTLKNLLGGNPDLDGRLSSLGNGVKYLSSGEEQGDDPPSKENDLKVLEKIAIALDIPSLKNKLKRFIEGNGG